MQLKISLKRPWPLIGVVSIVEIVFSSIVIFFLIFNLSTHNSYIKPVLPGNSLILQNLTDDEPAEPVQTIVFGEQASPGLPISLQIPKIKVNAAIKQVGLTPSGAMDVPKTAQEVAWFKLGPRPGDNGSAVIAGHYGRWKNGKGSVFDNLNKLKKGDVLYIKDEKGMTNTFVVREIRKYDPKADASGVFISRDGKSHLNLVTCGGIWNKVSKSYSQRLVVFTDKEEAKEYLLMDHFASYDTDAVSGNKSTEESAEGLPEQKNDVLAQSKILNKLSFGVVVNILQKITER